MKVYYQCKCLGGFEIDENLELDRLFNGEIGGLHAVKNALDQMRRAVPQIAKIDPIYASSPPASAYQPLAGAASRAMETLRFEVRKFTTDTFWQYRHLD